MYQFGRRPGVEGCVSLLKRSTTNSTSNCREDTDTSTSREHENHFGLEVVIHGGRKYEGSIKVPSTETRTTAGRSSEGNCGISHCAG
jgi:hypothetical protein